MVKVATISQNLSQTGQLYLRKRFRKFRKQLPADCLHNQAFITNFGARNQYLFFNLKYSINDA